LSKIALISLILAVLGVSLIVGSFTLPRELGLKKQHTLNLGGQSSASVETWLDSGDQITVTLPALSNGSIAISGSEYNYTDVFYDVASFTIFFNGPSGLYNISIRGQGGLSLVNVSVVGYKYSVVQNIVSAVGFTTLIAGPGLYYGYHLTRRQPDTKEGGVGGVSVVCRTLGYDRHRCTIKPAERGAESTLGEEVLSALYRFLEEKGYQWRVLEDRVLFARHKTGRNELTIIIGPSQVSVDYRVRKLLAKGSRDLEWVFGEAFELASLISERLGGNPGSKVANG